MQTFIVALIGIAASGGAGFYGWQQKQALDRTVVELAHTRAALTRATTELRAARETLRDLVMELQIQQAPR